MALQLKAEPGSSPLSNSTTDSKTYNEMSISELVSVLRVSFQTEDFDRVEEELMNRDVKLKADIGPLQEKVEVERLRRIEAEEGLKKKEEQCEKGKRAQENYEHLLREIKKNGLVEKNITDELKKKNAALEREICELKDLKKKWLDDEKQIRSRMSELEEEKVGYKGVIDALSSNNSELEKAIKIKLTVQEGLTKKKHALECELKEGKKKWLDGMAELRRQICALEEEKIGDKNALDALSKKNSELEKTIKSNLRVIEELKTEKGKLEDAKRKGDMLLEGLRRKFGELDVRLVKLEDATQHLCDTNTKVQPHPHGYGVKDEEVDDTGTHLPFQRNPHTRHSLDAQSGSKGNKDTPGLKLKDEVIVLDDDGNDDDKDDDDDDDDDDVGCTSQGLHGKKAISQIIAENEHPSSLDAIKHKNISTEAQRTAAIKRKCLADLQISSSSSSSDDSLEFDENFAPKKRRKSVPDSSGFNFLPSYFLTRKI